MNKEYMASFMPRSQEEYGSWLKHQSISVQKKATRFAELFGTRTLPLIVTVEADTYQGEGGEAHIFLHPSSDLQEIMGDIVW